MDPTLRTEPEQIARATEILREHGETIERVIFEALAIPLPVNGVIFEADKRLAYVMAGPQVGFVFETESGTILRRI